MAVIWGLDLKEMQWGKFKNSYMWNNEYHLRRTKFIVYQLAMIFCVISESLGTAALSDYLSQQDYVQKHHPGATIHNNAYIGIASYNIFVGIYVATIFGSAFFFDLFWPERRESPAVKTSWRICSVLACFMTLACAIAYTVILTRRVAWITGAPDSRTGAEWVDEYHGSPLAYRKNGRAIASGVFEWLGVPATFASTYIMWRSLAHNDKLGPKSTHARLRDSVGEKPEANAADVDASSAVSNDALGDEPTPTVPAAVHTGPIHGQEGV